MIQPQFIRKIIAAVMLIVFAISITPTIVFHKWLADHTDTVKKCTDLKGEHVGKRTFNCHCDNIVAESPFVEPVRSILSPTPQIFSLYKVERQVHFTASPTIGYTLRGPPAV